MDILDNEINLSENILDALDKYNKSIGNKINSKEKK